MSHTTSTPWKLHTESLIIGPGGSLDHVARVVRNADAAFIVKAVNAHEALLLAAKDAMLMIKDLSDALYVRPEKFRDAPVVDRLFKAIALAEGRHE